MKTENKKPIMCSICGRDIPKDPLSSWDKGHNAQPINNGRCCDNCNNLVLVRRINDMRRAKLL